MKGRVVNGVNSTPVPGSSVFINNTSKGTTTDKNGYFELNDISSGKHELIISSIGYETMVHPFAAEQLPLQLRIELADKSKGTEKCNRRTIPGRRMGRNGERCLRKTSWAVRLMQRIAGSKMKKPSGSGIIKKATG
ncbi:MAG: carboxypeptidase-like regulatory domain-containing protein [Bacteroidota bacterium]